MFVLTFRKLFLKNYSNPNKIRGKHLTRATAPPPINNRFPQKVQKELHAFSAKTTNKAKICGKRCICLVIFPDKVEFQEKNASKCNPITQITEKELPSPHKATSPRPNTHRKPIPKTNSPSSIRTVAKFFGVCKSTENFVLSGYKHMGIWHVSLTCRYPYAFV